jgi:hypothetical protein
MLLRSLFGKKVLMRISNVLSLLTIAIFFKLVLSAHRSLNVVMMNYVMMNRALLDPSDSRYVSCLVESRFLTLMNRNF